MSKGNLANRNIPGLKTAPKDETPIGMDPFASETAGTFADLPGDFATGINANDPARKMPKGSESKL